MTPEREMTVTERDCPETPGIVEQERRFVELLPLIEHVQVFGDRLGIHTEPGVFLLFRAGRLPGSEDADSGAEEYQCPYQCRRP